MSCWQNTLMFVIYNDDLVFVPSASLVFHIPHHEHNSEGLNLWPPWQPDQVLKSVALTWKLYSALHCMNFASDEQNCSQKGISAVWEDRGWWKRVRWLEDSKVRCVQDSCWTHKHNRILIHFSPASHFYFIHFLWNGLETESCWCLNVFCQWNRC